MTEKYIISKADFGPYQELAASIPAARLSIYIMEAQSFDLKPFMGLAFYQDFMRQLTNNTDGSLNITALSQPYKDFLNGVNYEDLFGKSIDHPGLQRMLVYYTISRMAQWGNFAFTTTGLVKKKHEEADPLSGKEISIMVSENRSKGKAIENEVRKFLTTKIAQYPLYFVDQESSNRRASGARISGVDRSNFNLPYNTNGLPPDWFIN